MASIQQQGAGFRLNEAGTELGDDLAGGELDDPGIYVSPPLVGETPDYPGGVSTLDEGQTPLEAPFEQEESLEPRGGWTSQVAAIGREVDARLRREINEHPYRTLAAAVAVGYLLHEGVTSKPGRFALLMGGRYALKAFASSMAGVEE